MLSLSSSEEATFPSHMIAVIVFLQARCLAWMWKNCVFASPSASQSIRDRCLAIVRYREARPGTLSFNSLRRSRSIGEICRSS